MPNYSHGTKLTLASAEEPPYLSIGTDVSAKYKGAFCEAKITHVNKHVKLRVLFEGSNGTYLIDDTNLKAGSILETGTKIEAKHPEKKQQTYVQATITKILDHSRYTVVFDDGDQCVLRRNSLCIKSGKHFAESETLDRLPLTNPEHFGNPVKVGAIEQSNNSNSVHTNTNKAQSNHQVLNDKPKGKSSTNSSSTTSDDTKSISNSNETNNNRKRQHQPQDNNNGSNKKLRREKSSSLSVNSAVSAASGGSRRGATKGRKRRESINNGSKNAAAAATGSGLDDDSVDSSADSGDANSGESNVKFESIEIGVKLMVQYGKGKVQNVYEAKVNKIETNSAGKTRYFVHYTGWNNRYDEWITRNRILSIVTEKENGSRDGRSRQSESTPTTTTTTTALSTTSTSSITSSSSSSLKEKEKDRDKEKEKEIDTEKEKEKEKEREKEERETREKEEREREEREEKEREAREKEEREAREKEERERKERETREKEEREAREKEERERKEREEKERETREKEEREAREKEERERKEREKEREREKLKEKEKEKDKFCEEIDESDCDKKISIIQDRMMALRQTYISLRTELANLDRKRKRPRSERSTNSEHISCS